MPAGKGCGGVVDSEATNANECITQFEFEILTGWVFGGLDP